MRALVVVMALTAARPVWADGVPFCKNCQASGDPASIGSGLALVGLVAYRIGRRRRA